MPKTDPLTMRHGAFISQTWSMIAEARSIARNAPTMAQCATQLRRLRYLHTKIRAIHRREMHRLDASSPAIDGWFQPVEDCLTKAETYFADLIRVQNARLKSDHAATSGS